MRIRKTTRFKLFSVFAVLGLVGIGVTNSNSASASPVLSGPVILEAVSNDSNPSPTGTAANNGWAQPTDVAVDSLGNVLYVGTSYSTLQVLARSSTDPGYLTGGATWTVGHVYQIGGIGVGTPSASGTDPTDTGLNVPQGVTLDPTGNILVADGNAIELFAVSSTKPAYVGGSVSWVRGHQYKIGASSGATAAPTTGASVISTQLPATAVSTDHQGNIVLVNGTDHSIEVIAASASDPGYLSQGATWTVGNVYTIAAATTSNTPATTGTSALSTALTPARVVVDARNNIVVGDALHLDVIATTTDPGYLAPSVTWIPHNLYVIAGDGGTNHIAPTAGADPSTKSIRPTGLTIDQSGNILVGSRSATVQLYAVSATPSNYLVTGASWTQRNLYTVAGIHAEADSPNFVTPMSATTASMYTPYGVAVGPTGNMLIGDSDQINEVTAPPSAPLSFTATPGSGHLMLTWATPSSSGGAAISGYVLAEVIDGVPQEPISLGASTFSYDVTNLADDTTHSFIIAAINSVGRGVLSTATATTAATVVTPPVSGITAPIHIAPDGTVTDVPVYPTPDPTQQISVSTPSGDGSWTLNPDGGVFTAGDAGFYGSMGGTPLNAPAVGITPTPSGNGYLIVGADGGVFAFGDAPFQGSMGGHPLNAPITGIGYGCSSTGYYLVGGDGGVFNFGDVGFYGSMGGQPLNQSMLGIVDACGKHGYWTFAKDGGVFSFGDAGFYGSMGNNPPPGGIIGMVSASDGNGYWLVGADKHLYPFGSAVSAG